MDKRLLSRIIMLGAQPETRGSIAAVVEGYRAHGVFQRWPVEHVAMHATGGVLERSRETLKALGRFAAALGRERRAAVHAHTGASWFWHDSAFLALAFAARRPVILQLHGGGFEAMFDAAGAPARALFHAALGRAASVVVPSDLLGGWVRRLHRHALVRCIPSPVSRPQLRRSGPRQNVVLFLGKLEAAKGVFDLLEAVAAVRRAIPDVRLVCAGEGDRGAVARYADRLGILEAVKFTGWVGPSGKRALLESAAVFALPCYGAGLPIGLLEAMSAGIPVIASPVGGIPEVVADGVSGLLVAPGDTATLARHLRTLLADRALSARIGAAARESIRRRHSPERTIAQLEDLYASLGVVALGARPPAPPQVDLRKAA
jgi:glycosyltransferase involved in cell wall biosynthesis